MTNQNITKNIKNPWRHSKDEKRNKNPILRPTHLNKQGIKAQKNTIHEDMN